MPKNHDKKNIAEWMYGIVAPVKNRSMAIFRIGNGVLVKVKWLGLGGSRREAAAMEIIRQQAPSVLFQNHFIIRKIPIGSVTLPSCVSSAVSKCVTPGGV